MLLFAIGAAFLASALFSLAPLWQALRTAPNTILTDGVRASAGARTRKLSQSLVVAEIALAATLLAVSALLFTQLSTLFRVPKGFDPGHLLIFKLNADEARYNDKCQDRRSQAAATPPESTRRVAPLTIALRPKSISSRSARTISTSCAYLSIEAAF